MISATKKKFAMTSCSIAYGKNGLPVRFWKPYSRR